MPRYLDPPSLSKPHGTFSHGVLVGAMFKRLVASPQIGVRKDGTLAEGLEAQLDQALDNFLLLLSAAGLDSRDIVRLAIHTSVPDASDLCAKARDLKLGPTRPALAYREVSGFAIPGCLVDVEGEAVREA